VKAPYDLKIFLYVCTLGFPTPPKIESSQKIQVMFRLYDVEDPKDPVREKRKKAGRSKEQKTRTLM
jgi:hypothetical protein